MAKKDKEVGQEEVKEKSGKGLMAVLFILGLIVLGAASFGGVYLFMKTNNTVAAQQVLEETYVDLDEFTINLGDKDGKRYFRGEISIGYDKTNKKVGQEIAANTVVIRDAIIFYFKGKEASYVNDINNEENIKKDLIEAINKELQKGKVTDLRFKNMIVQ